MTDDTVKAIEKREAIPIAARKQELMVQAARIAKGAYVAAGSSITEDVPAGSLGIARGRQTNVVGWVDRKKEPAAKT